MYFNHEHKKFRENLRSFLQKEIVPYANLWEKNHIIPKNIWRKLANAGFLGLHYPKSFGGKEKDFFYSVILLEELGLTGYAGFGIAVGVHTYMSTFYLANSGSDRLKEKYLYPALLGEKIGSLAITETHGGSDLDQIQTIVTTTPNDCIIEGNKKFIANGSIADFVVVAVKTDEILSIHKHKITGISLVVVDVPTTGLYVRKLDMLGWYSLGTSAMDFNQVRIPFENIICTAHQGFLVIVRGLQLERLVAGILAIGGAEYCLKLVCTYLLKRKVFNKALSQYQAIRHRISILITELEAVRQLAYYTALLFEQGKIPILQCSMVKYKSTELAVKIAQECMQFYGAHGLENDNPMSRIYRDVRATTVAGGASEILLDTISQLILNEAEWGI